MDLQFMVLNWHFVLQEHTISLFRKREKNKNFFFSLRMLNTKLVSVSCEHGEKKLVFRLKIILFSQHRHRYPVWRTISMLFICCLLCFSSLLFLSLFVEETIGEIFAIKDWSHSFNPIHFSFNIFSEYIDVH